MIAIKQQYTLTKENFPIEARLAAAAETKERVNGIMAGDITAAGLDVERQVKKVQGKVSR